MVDICDVWEEDKKSRLKNMVSKEIWSQIESTGWLSKKCYYAAADLQKIGANFPPACEESVSKYVKSLLYFTRRKLQDGFVTKVMEPGD